MRDNLKANCPRLPLSALRLLVSPVRLVSAAVWQTIEQKAVAHYGMLEEFVSMVTDLVPELLTTEQRARLVLGLRARLILELCRSEDSSHSEVVQPHLDRMQTLVEACVKEDGTTSVDFVDFVKDMLEDPETRDNFYETVFPEEFGPAFDDALCTLTWLLLSRLEKFLPLQTFQQVASMFGDVSSVLQDCMAPVCQGEELRIVLQYHKEKSQLDKNDGSMDGACIISALNFHRKQSQDAILDPVPSHAGTEVPPPPRTTQTDTDTIPECRAIEIKLHRIDLIPACKSAPRKEKPSTAAVSVIEDPSTSMNDAAKTAPNCSEDDSWSYYSDNDSFHQSPSSSDSWSYYSDAASSLASPGQSPPQCDSLSGCSDEDPSFRGQETLSPSKRKPQKAKGVPPKTKKCYTHCFICKELLNESLRSHMKTHFPSGEYTCPHCNKIFQCYISLKAHMRKVCFQSTKKPVDEERPEVGQNLYKCDKCQDEFSYKVSLVKHKVTHHELYCSVCRRVVRDAAMLARHKASHTVFQCIRCEETFTFLAMLLRHCESVHRIVTPFACNHCPKTFPKLRALVLHEWKHTGHLPYLCAQCGARFRCAADLRHHERVHTREKPFLCPECGRTFGQNSNLMRHMRFVHSELRNEKKYSCSQCEKSFKEKGSLKKHQRTSHLKELFRYPCPHCGMLVARSTLARHIMIHTGERPFKCTVAECDRNFRSAVEVKNHILLRHTSERPFKCDVCGKGFTRKGFLTAHIKIHSGKRPFACPICGKAFLKVYGMERHKRLIHSIIKE